MARSISDIAISTLTMWLGWFQNGYGDGVPYTQEEVQTEVNLRFQVGIPS